MKRALLKENASNQIKLVSNNENEVHTVAVPKEKEALKQHIAFNYPQWKLVDYDSFNDAEDMVIKEAEAILERVGLKIERVEDGVQCVNKVAKMPVGTYDMILMDIQMPKMDGYKATQEIRHLPDKDKACIPIIAMTASAFEEDKREAIASGMNGHIAKPIDVNELMAILVENIR